MSYATFYHLIRDMAKERLNSILSLKNPKVTKKILKKLLHACSFSEHIMAGHAPYLIFLISVDTQAQSRIRFQSNIYDGAFLRK